MSEFRTVAELLRALDGRGDSKDARRTFDDRVHMCIGVESGPLLRLDDDAYGDPVNVAYKLGEDLAGRGEILVGATLFGVAQDAGFDFSPYDLSEQRSAITGNVPLAHRVLRLK